MNEHKDKNLEEFGNIPVELLTVFQIFKERANGDRVQAMKNMAESALKMLHMETSKDTAYLILAMELSRLEVLSALAEKKEMSVEELISHRTEPDAIAEEFGLEIQERKMQ